MTEKQAKVDELQDKLKKLEGERTKALALADQAQSEVKHLRQSLVIINDDELPPDQKAKAKAELLADKEKSELNDSRARVALLESQLEASRDPDSPNYRPDAKRLVTPENKSLSKNDKIAAPKMASADDLGGDVTVASHVVAPRPTRRPAYARATSQRVASAASRLQAIEPAAGAPAMPAVPATGKPTISDNWFGGKPVSPVKAVQPAKPAADDMDAANNGVDSMESPSGQFNENRASAFLDRIMTYHTGGKPAPMKDTTPVFSATPAVKPAAPKTVAHAKTGAITPAKLSQIETASGDAGMPVNEGMNMPVHGGIKMSPSIVDKKSPSVADADAPKKSGSLISWLSPDPAPVAATKPVEHKELPVQSILSSAGVRDATFADASGKKESKEGLALRQWTTGDGISGMYEQTTASRSFDVNVQKYLDRYRKDCKDLKVKLDQPETSGDVMFTQANISCSARGNNYSTSLVFAQTDDSFNAILHSGFPSDAAEVKSIGNSVARAIAKSNNPLTRDVDTATAITHDAGLEIVVPGKSTASKSSAQGNDRDSLQ